MYRWLLSTIGAIALCLVVHGQASAAGVVGDGTAGSCTEAALDAALAGGGLVTFDCGPGSSTIHLTGAKHITTDTTIVGDGSIALSGSDTTNIFVVTGASLTLESMYLIQASSATNGGAILAEDGATLVADGIVFGSSSAVDGGGAIAVVDGSTATVTSSSITGNSAGRGGAVYLSNSDVTINDSYLIENSAAMGGAIYAVADAGGTATLTVVDSTIVDSASAAGSAIQGDSLACTGTVEVDIVNSTLGRNDAPSGGVLGGDDCSSTTLRFSTVADNTGMAVFASGTAPPMARASAIANNETDTCALGAAPDATYTVADDAGCVSSDPSNLVVADVGLDAVAPYYGAEAAVPASGSPVVDHVPAGAEGCGSSVATDVSTIVTRPQNTACDAGSAELEFFPEFPVPDPTPTSPPDSPTSSADPEPLLPNTSAPSGTDWPAGVLAPLALAGLGLIGASSAMRYMSHRR